MADDDDEQRQPQSRNSLSGMLPPFLKKTLLTPKLGLGALAVVGVACIPFLHLHPPDVGTMAKSQLGGVPASAATDDTPEVPDPTPSPTPRTTSQFPAVTPHTVAARGTPPATTIQNTAVAQAAVVAQQMPPPTSTPQPVPPSDTHGVFGEPSDTELNPAAPAVPAVAPASSREPQRGDFAADRGADRGENGALGYVPAVSKYELSEGAVIHCRWLTHVDSEQAGHVSGQVIEPVYSTLDPQVEVVPAGAEVQGWYKTASTGTTRLIVAWHRINFPDGRKFEMGEQPATDLLGGTGANGTVNSGAGKIFGQALLYTALNAAGQSLSHSIVLQGSSITQGFSSQQQQVKPTIYIDPTARFDINVVRDLPLDRFEVRE